MIVLHRGLCKCSSDHGFGVILKWKANEEMVRSGSNYLEFVV